MKNIIDDLTRYRIKVEREGKEIVNIPGILCIPGVLAAPKLSLIGMVAAPILGCSIRLENGDGREVDLEKSVQEAAETVVDTAKTAAKTIKEEMDKAWQAISAEDQPEAEDETVQEDPAVQDAAEEPAADPEKGIPAVPVNPDDSAQE